MEEFSPCLLVDSLAKNAFMEVKLVLDDKMRYDKINLDDSRERAVERLERVSFNPIDITMSCENAKVREQT